ncbi:hypothetical protein A5662_03850 [Mycobacteriaceae bacterium 1482268.1]|nr:hypothetical protein A5662_03850 [Mycobacteriaceae bacterium 1482268.1]
MRQAHRNIETKEYEMSTFPSEVPSNQGRDWTKTQAAPWRTPAPDVPTMGAFFPPTQARPAEPLPPSRQAYGPGYGSPYLPDLAWAAEQPEFSMPAGYASPQPWYTRPKVVGFAAAGLAEAAAAGLFGALHSSSSSTPVNTAAQSSPAPAPAPTPAPAPAVAAPAASLRPSYRPMSHSASGGGYSAPSSHQAMPATPPPPAAPQGQPGGDDRDGSSNHDSGSDPSHWNDSGNYWWTHWGNHDNRWRWNGDHDHDSRWRSDRSDSSHDSSSDSRNSQ